MLKKHSAGKPGPSWTEVLIGAALSALIGVILGAANLILKPVASVREIPKDAAPGDVFYIEGLRDSGKASEAEGKRREFAEGHSVTLTEAEINALAPAAAAPAPAGNKAPPAAAAGAPAPAAAPAAHWLEAGPLNVRLSDGTLQLASMVRVTVYGVEQKVLVQARGVFAKHGDYVVFLPQTATIGSCPVTRIPGVASWFVYHLLLPQPIPADLSAAWAKLSDAAIEGSTLHLTVP